MGRSEKPASVHQKFEGLERTAITWRCKRNCSNCGLDYNADLNGARNILDRSLGYMRDRAEVNQPLSSTVISISDEENICEQRAMEEAYSLMSR